MPRLESHPANTSWQDITIEKLENRLIIEPDDRPAIKRLVTILDSYVPNRLGLGTYSDCQRKLAIQFHKENWISDILRPGKTAEHYKKWQAFLNSMGVNPQIPIAQLSAGNTHKISGEETYCSLRLSLFEKEEVISRICHDCYKVQILPLNLMALIQVYFVVQGLELPRDNARKCMVELREDVPFPYKGYIYCESEDEAHFCLRKFQQTLEAFHISNVYSGISHGCSEYGLKYPKFKYSKDGTHRSFERPALWDQAESKFFAVNQKPLIAEKGFNKEGISILDVIGFRTWVDYAEIIGDDSFGKFRDGPNDKKPEPFATRIRKQSQLRKSQMEELRERLSSNA